MIWKYQRIADKGSSPLVVGDHVYAQGERRLACVELATGKEAWSTTLDLSSPQYTSLVAADGKVIYAFDGLLCFAADATEYKPLFDVKFDRTGLMASEQLFRQRLKLDELEKQPQGQEKSVKLYRREVGQQGPLACASPALADGRIYLRLNTRWPATIFVCHRLNHELARRAIHRLKGTARRDANTCSARGA